MNLTEVQAAYAQYVFGNYTRAPIAITRAAGSYVWDSNGKRYLDLLPGLGVNGLGHCPPRVVAALNKQAAQMLHIHNNYLWEQQALLAKGLAERLTGMEKPKAFFCNSGTEASEAAIKLARLHGKQKSPAKWRFISVENCFHGRTFAALTATAQDNMQRGFEPLVPGFSYVPLYDTAALERAFDAETAGFMVEPVQGEGGIFASTRAYLEAARALCDRHGALLMYDEVQCGMGRTGDYFAYQTLKAPAPDLLWLAKTLGGGFPIGALLARGATAQLLVPGTHGSTFGGNPLACAAGLAVLETIEQDHLLQHVRDMARHLQAGLELLRSRHAAKIKEVRQVGLMVGIDLNFPAKPVYTRCLEEGLMINATHETTVRLLPAMTVSAAELDEGLAIISRVLGEL
ncbi:MAG: aspartate aminotransferase family protein [Planctomycetota bacterium]